MRYNYNETPINVFLKFLIGFLEILFVLAIIYAVIRLLIPGGDEWIAPLTNWLVNLWNSIINSV